MLEVTLLIFSNNHIKMAYLTLEINLICYANLEFYSAITSPISSLGHWQAECPLATASVGLVFVKNPAMENTLQYLNTSATKALAGYRYIAEILTSCHTELLRSIQSDESTKETAESYDCSLTVCFVRRQKNPATFFLQ